MHINARVGTLRSRIFRTPRAFSGKFRVLPTTQSAAAARRCGRFGEPCFCYAKMVRLSTRPKQKQTIKKMELIKTIRTRVGTVRSRFFRTPRAFSGKSRVLPTTQSAAATRRCGRFGEPCFCCAKMVRLSTRPKQKQTIKKMVCFCLVGEGGFGPPKLKSNRFTVCPLWPLGNSPIMELVMGLEPATC